MSIIQIIILLINLITIIVIVDVVLTWVLDPYHPLRQTLDHVVEPVLMPIRRVLPFMGGLDFSPIVLLLLIQLIGQLLIGLVR